MATYDPPSCIHGFSGNGAGCDVCEAADACLRTGAILDEIAAIIGTRFMDPPDGGDVSLVEQVRRLVNELATAHAILTDDEDESVVGAAEQRMRDLETWKECSATDSERAARAEAMSRDGFNPITGEPATGEAYDEARRDAAIAREGLSRSMPVAWRYGSDDEGWAYWRASEKYHHPDAEPLYTSPLPTSPASVEGFKRATPRPWHLDDGYPLAVCQSDGSSLGVMEPGFPQITEAEMKANARLVVQAVNAYDGGAEVAALRQRVEVLEAALEECRAGRESWMRAAVAAGVKL